jgi:hypothetical protein
VSVLLLAADGADGEVAIGRPPPASASFKKEEEEVAATVVSLSMCWGI